MNSNSPLNQRTRLFEKLACHSFPSKLKWFHALKERNGWGMAAILKSTLAGTLRLLELGVIQLSFLVSCKHSVTLLLLLFLLPFQRGLAKTFFKSELIWPMLPEHKMLSRTTRTGGWGGGKPFYRLCRYLRSQRVWFSAVLVINRVLLLYSPGLSTKVLQKLCYGNKTLVWTKGRNYF